MLLLALTSLYSQQMTPLDSLYAQDSLGIGARIVFKPIQLWQHFSYSQATMNCQFENSCSNFMVQAIQDKGLIRGTVVGTDRIVRCNPAARHYHIQLPDSRIQYDGRLVEPLDWKHEPHPGKSPALAVALSVIPGLGRAYAGHPIDGMFSFLLVAGFAFNTYSNYQSENAIRTSVSGSLMTLFWFADMYGAFRTAKMVPDNPTP